MTQTIGKGGVVALAYPASDPASLVTLALYLRCNESHTQARLSLQSSLLLNGSDDVQIFHLQYNADNLIPGTISFKPTITDISQARLATLARHGSPQIHTLSLTLKECCPVWCSSSGPFTPRSGCGASFRQLINLAKATKLHILFDHRWLSHDKKAILQQLVEHPNRLSNLPLDRHLLQTLRRVHGEDLNIQGIDADAEADATTEDEEPPPYVETSSKRPRGKLRVPSSM